MNKTYNEPEFKRINMTDEDVLTASRLDDATSGWETNSDIPGGGTVPIITL